MSFAETVTSAFTCSKAYPLKLISPEHSVAKIVERMKEAATREANLTATNRSSWDDYGADYGSATTPSVIPNLDIHPITLQPPFTPHPDDHYHVNDLLRFHDRDFVRNAYLAILKRQPDADGFQGFLDGLASGELNKIDVLARLRFSREGREKKVRVDGLWAPAALRTAYRIPVFGYLLNLTVAFARIPASLRNQRQFESHFLAQQRIVVEQLNHLGRSVLVHAKETNEKLTNQTAVTDRLGAEVGGQLATLSEEHAAAHEVVLTRIGELNSYFEDRLNDESAERLEAVADVGRQLGQALSRLSERDEQLELKVSDLDGQLKAQFEELKSNEHKLKTELVLQGQRVARLFELAEKGFRVSPEAAEPQLDSHLLDAFYAEFDEAFRGSREGIKERLAVYLPYINKSGAGTAAAPVLDVGCGRGEWLELLKERGLHARGVESNSVLAGQCRERGLSVSMDDLSAYVQNLPDESLGAVTGFHIVEHLPVEVLVKFLNETVRVLRPGGLVVFETPNPQNVLVGSCNFYFDPTHRNPLPSQVLKFLLESRGFSQVEVLPLNPSDAIPVAGESEIVARFNQYFYGPMDYGVVGWKI